jgi:hypothetical protein
MWHEQENLFSIQRTVLFTENDVTPKDINGIFF